MNAVCELCAHRCRLSPGQTGLCRARENRGGAIVCKNYGLLTSLALDPIEKKPLRRFFPGSKILSCGSFGCNLHCPFCQNHEISMAGAADAETVFMPPEALVRRAELLREQGNIGIAYTYNEPLVGYEYVADCARPAREAGLKNVLVTNGYCNPEPWKTILPLIDAMNVDLKGFTPAFYQKLGGDLETVKANVAAAVPVCHVEVTTLLIPGENDSDAEIDRLSGWLAALDPEIPLHLSRFFPRWHYADRAPTPVATVRRLTEVARRNLRHVYSGNC